MDADGDRHDRFGHVNTSAKKTGPIWNDTRLSPLVSRSPREQW
jgi:hypothetical protein